jgi:hypothetical protein
MIVNTKIAWLSVAVCLGLAACGETGETSETGETATEGSGQHEAVAEAMVLFPDYATLHKEVITRTCTPNAGVCHNQKEYPDLHTPGSMLAVIGKPCNLDEDDPLEVFNGCEPVGDVAVLELSPVPAPMPMPMPDPPAEPIGFEAEVAWVEFTLDDEQLATGVRVHLRAPITEPMPASEAQVRFTRSTKSGTIDVGVLGQVTWTAGDSFFTIANTELDAADLDLLETSLVVGDPNRDGEFGADDAFHMLEPGEPARSYLLQRLQGNVPGSPMPLANQPLSSAEIVALACWIESLAAPGAESDVGLVINYETCKFAESFAGGAVIGGHSLVDDVQPILDQSCAFAGCHAGAAPSAGLDLSADAAQDSLLRASGQNPEQQLIEPGNPTNSYLITKLTGNGIAGVQMPKDGEPLDEVSIGIIRQWISEGAAND